jgi:hypothetical protein
MHALRRKFLALRLSLLLPSAASIDSAQFEWRFREDELFRRDCFVFREDDQFTTPG